MNKLTKKVIKSVVKECLVEILAEGMYANKSTTNKKRKQNLKENIYRSKQITSQGEYTQISNSNQGRNNRRPSYLDNISYGNSSKQNQTKKIQNTNITANPVLNEMLADTASTTLQEQLKAESTRATSAPIATAGDKAAKIVDSHTPEEIFGETSSKWATLAFADKIQR